MAMYRCGSNSGGGVTPAPITPSDSTPAALTANTPVNPTANGYAIVSQPQNVTPSASGAAFNSGIVKMSSSGYAYSQQQSITKIGSGSYSGSSEITVTLGFKPKYLAVYGADTSVKIMNIYDEDVSTTQFLRAYGSAYAAWVNIGTTPYCIRSITNTGFSVSGYGSITAGFRYFAIG